MCRKEDRMHIARILATDGHSQKDIAAKLGVSDRMVRKYLKEDFGTRVRKKRRSIIEPFHRIIDEAIEENPYTNLVLLYERLKRQRYGGGMTILRDYARGIREKVITKAVLRFESEPGRQAQVDWKECGSWCIDGRMQKLYAFVMLLGYSRQPFVLFTTNMRLSTVLLAHLAAFAWFGAVPREILYDNMKTAWLNQGGSWIVNPGLLSLASACGFTPLRCKVRRPQTKGKVERFIGYLAHNFLPRVESRAGTTLEELNGEVADWLKRVNAQQISGIRSTRAERFAEEKPYMNQWVPEAAPDVRETVGLVVSREGQMTYQTNRYSVPADYIGQMVTMKINTLNYHCQVFSRENLLLREFTLSVKGTREVNIRKEDSESLIERWKAERRPVPQKVPQEGEDLQLSDELRATSVETRNPACYDKLVGAAS
mgnify:CR=1 FL=1